MRCCGWSYLHVPIMRHKVNYIRTNVQSASFDTIYYSLHGRKMGLTEENRNLLPSLDGPLNLGPRRSTILSPIDQLPWFELHGFSFLFGPRSFEFGHAPSRSLNLDLHYSFPFEICVPPSTCICFDNSEMNRWCSVFCIPWRWADWILHFHYFTVKINLNGAFRNIWSPNAASFDVNQYSHVQMFRLALITPWDLTRLK